MKAICGAKPHSQVTNTRVGQRPVSSRLTRIRSTANEQNRNRYGLIRTVTNGVGRRRVTDQRDKGQNRAVVEAPEQGRVRFKAPDKIRCRGTASQTGWTNEVTELKTEIRRT